MSGSTLSSGGSNSTLGKGAITVGGNASNGTLKLLPGDGNRQQAFSMIACGSIDRGGHQLCHNAHRLSNLTTTNTANSVAGNGWALGGAGNLKLTGVVSDSANATKPVRR